ncbi:MAG: zinc ribbon domain-containing protein [Gemmatimonadales bacterium]
MTDQRGTDLKELQKLDNRIAEARRRISDFDPRLQEVEEPALVLQGELGTTKTRLQELKLEERRLELATEEKRTRRKRLDERLGSVRNLREEAAVSAELEMVKRALQNDEQEMLGLIDQLRKTEERARELEGSYAEASERVGPKREELLAERTEAEKELETLRADRTRFVAGVDAAELKIYDAIRAGGRTTAVADLTEDGACGHCFGMVPLQLRNEIRHGEELIRCESCGVILTAPTPAAVAPGGNEGPRE